MIPPIKVRLRYSLARQYNKRNTFIHSFTKITKQRLAQPTQRPIMSDSMCRTFRKLIIVVRVFYCLQLNTIYNVMNVIKS